MKYIFKSCFVIFFCIVSFSQAQDKNDTIKTDKLIIIKQYSPTLNDAFKVKSKPSVSDSIKQTQKTVDYSIFSVPVASTFTPVKGSAGVVKPQKRPYNYQNYARLGAGNFTNILGQFYGSLFLNRYKKLNIEFDHLSSAGGIDGVVLDDDFMDTALNLNLESSERYFNWDAGIGVDYKRYNWYGIDQQNLNTNNQIFGTTLSAIDPLQTYLGLSANAKLEFDSDYIKTVKLKLNNFSDDYNSSENQVDFNANFNVYVQNQKLDIGLDLNYLNGNFEQSFNDSNTEIDYGFITASIYPSYKIEIDDFTIDLGAKVSFLNDTEYDDTNLNITRSETEFFVYPKIKASYKWSEEIMFYAGADGDLNHNSYQSIVDQNPFVSPTLFLQPTDNAISGFAGINGKVGTLSYNLKTFYKQENDYAFFVENPAFSVFTPFISQNNFEFSNSFGLIYDDLSTLGINAEFNYAAFDDFNIGISAQYFNYDVDNIPEPSYLPDFKVNLNANYQIGEKWYLHSTLFFVGERNSLTYGILPADGIGLMAKDVDSFVDLNFGIDYQFTERLGFFISGKNLLDDNYQQWRNYKVQGLQVMGGLSYQFDW